MWPYLCGRPFGVRIRKRTFVAPSDIRKRTPHSPHTFRTVRKVCGRCAEANGIRNPVTSRADADADVRMRIADTALDVA